MGKYNQQPPPCPALHNTTGNLLLIFLLIKILLAVAEVCWIHFSCVDRCIEGCSDDIVTRLRGNAGSSTCSRGQSAPWSGYACTFLLRRRSTTTTRTRCGTSLWPAAWCSCCRPRRGTRRRWDGAGAGAGTGDPGFVGTRSVRAARTNSTLSHRQNRDAVRKQSD